MTTQQTDFPIPVDLPPGFWNWDRIHCPHPTAPLEQELMLDTTAAGLLELGPHPLPAPHGAAGAGVDAGHDRRWVQPLDEGDGL